MSTGSPAVALVPVDEEVLEHLVTAAVDRAGAERPQRAPAVPITWASRRSWSATGPRGPRS